MIKKSYVYGVQGLEDMISYLEDLKAQLNRSSNTIIDTAADMAQKSVEFTISSLDLDENLQGRVVTLPIKDGKKVSHIGDQVAFLEFGTGMVGKQSPHPLSPEYNWEYYIDSAFKDEVYGQEGWWFNGSFHTGIPAGRAVYNAGVEVRNRIPQIAKEKVKL